MLTNFQEIIAMALDLPDKAASRVQPNWPQDEGALRDCLRDCKNVLNLEIKGYELLAIVREIWRNRPADLEEIEGREILYHPVHGLPIYEGEALYDLDWEMLAFLRWATLAGHLKWTDEIAIAREIRGAGERIKDLPPDRFHYALISLPQLEADKIDWSNLGLAQAKDFVLNGPESLPVLPEIPWSDTNSLEGVLISIPALSDRSARDFLLRGLPRGPVSVIGRSSAPGTDIANIVSAVEGFGQLADGRMAINVLIDNALRLVRGTQMEAKLLAFKI